MPARRAKNNRPSALGDWYRPAVIGLGGRDGRTAPSLPGGAWVTRSIEIDAPGLYRVGVRGPSAGSDPEVFYYSPPFEVVLR